MLHIHLYAQQEMFTLGFQKPIENKNTQHGSTRLHAEAGWIAPLLRSATVFQRRVVQLSFSCCLFFFIADRDIKAWGGDKPPKSSAVRGHWPSTACEEHSVRTDRKKRNGSAHAETDLSVRHRWPETEMLKEARRRVWRKCLFSTLRGCVDRESLALCFMPVC